ncbi:MAG TPA: DUF4160 domain-containing protein [Acidimicrobiales bacterium]|nr:DUF4160 domain-containing protein [Acidimicrobiales bacterium]
MPRLSEFYGMVAFTYWRDHAPPHFHVEYGEAEALILVDDGAVSRLRRDTAPSGTEAGQGMATASQRRLLHKDELVAAWERVSRREDPGTIEPLP